MTKRRTRKDKESAKHTFTVSWKPDVSKNNSVPKKATFEANVKRQIPNAANKNIPNKHHSKLAMITDKNNPLASVNIDLAKSLIFAFLIIASEIVIYLFWYK